MRSYTLWQIAAELNLAGYRTRRGNAFHATAVQRLLLSSPVAAAWSSSR
ncbi:MAG: recombinase family protein [Bacteroidota bacterium]|nr:recombinase family protein [Bacteroidota bacterium]